MFVAYRGGTEEKGEGIKLGDLKHAKMIKVVLKEYSSCHSFEVESPFNYYGERGFVDLAQLEITNAIMPNGERTRWQLTLWEMKTKLEDVGQTLRQIHKAKKYFLKARKSINGIKIPIDIYLQSRLVFLDTLENWRVFNENIELFVEPTLLIDTIRNGERCWIGRLVEGKEWFELWTRRCAIEKRRRNLVHELG